MFAYTNSHHKVKYLIALKTDKKTRYILYHIIHFLQQYYIVVLSFYFLNGKPRNKSINIAYSHTPMI